MKPFILLPFQCLLFFFFYGLSQKKTKSNCDVLPFPFNGMSSITLYAFGVYICLQSSMDVSFLSPSLVLLVLKYLQSPAPSKQHTIFNSH